MIGKRFPAFFAAALLFACIVMLGGCSKTPVAEQNDAGVKELL